MRGRLAALAGAVLSLGACTSALPHAEPADAALAKARWGEPVTREDLESGRAAYVARCAGCHHLFLPADRPADRWPGVVEGMAERARLRPEQQRAIERYLVTMAARPR